MQDKTLLFLRNLISPKCTQAAEVVVAWSGGALVREVVARLESSSHMLDNSIVHALYCLSNFAAQGVTLGVTPNAPCLYVYKA